ncbi:MAG: uridine phosphorylase [Desulfurococcaceae archaeon]
MLKPGDVSHYVLLPGDPNRVPLIAMHWDKFWRVSANREYNTYSGYYKGVFISATSTGIGAPSAAIAVEELARVGSRVFIRVGTSGALRGDIALGDLVISTAAVRLDGTSRHYVMPEYPAVASYDVVLALIEAAESLGLPYHVGLTASSDSFYVGQERPGFKNYLPPFQKGLVEHLRAINVLSFEMESSAIFTLANIYGLRSGAVCATIANRETGNFAPGIGVDNAIKAANEAVKILSEWDQEIRRQGKRFLFPSLIKGLTRV